jgi:hypothetical protein
VFHPGFLLALFFLVSCYVLLSIFFNPEDGIDMFLRNVNWLSTDYTTLYPRRQNTTVCDKAMGWKTGEEDFFPSLSVKRTHQIVIWMKGASSLVVEPRSVHVSTNPDLVPKVY